MQIQTFTDKIETSYIVVFLNDTNCRFNCILQILKNWTLYFYSCPALDILCLWPKRFMVFNTESKH